MILLSILLLAMTTFVTATETDGTRISSALDTNISVDISVSYPWRVLYCGMGLTYATSDYRTLTQQVKVAAKVGDFSCEPFISDHRLLSNNGHCAVQCDPSMNQNYVGAFTLHSENLIWKSSLLVVHPLRLIAKAYLTSPSGHINYNRLELSGVACRDIGVNKAQAILTANLNQRAGGEQQFLVDFCDENAVYRMAQLHLWTKTIQIQFVDNSVPISQVYEVPLEFIYDYNYGVRFQDLTAKHIYLFNGESINVLRAKSEPKKAVKQNSFNDYLVTVQGDASFSGFGQSTVKVTSLGDFDIQTLAENLVECLHPQMEKLVLAQSELLFERCIASLPLHAEIRFFLGASHTASFQIDLCKENSFPWKMNQKSWFADHFVISALNQTSEVLDFSPLPWIHESFKWTRKQSKSRDGHHLVRAKWHLTCPSWLEQPMKGSLSLVTNDAVKLLDDNLDLCTDWSRELVLPLPAQNYSLLNWHWSLIVNSPVQLEMSWDGLSKNVQSNATFEYLQLDATLPKRILPLPVGSQVFLVHMIFWGIVGLFSLLNVIVYGKYLLAYYRLKKQMLKTALARYTHVRQQRDQAQRDAMTFIQHAIKTGLFTEQNRNTPLSQRPRTSTGPVQARLVTLRRANHDL